MANRMCYWISPSQEFNPKLKTAGYVPSMVTENEPGHSPMMGPGLPAVPWYWGMTYEEAVNTATKVNQEKFRLSELQVAEIVASSMGASRR